ncbi:hypothetical protein HY605_04850 [Candidatus Peregrinibacteria bacterium]|nr:hypothetical protein [Candidatus Peregrinibacteria bacterium]
MLRPGGNRFVEGPDANKSGLSQAVRTAGSLVGDLALAAIYQLTNRFDRPEDARMARMVAGHEAGHLLTAVLYDQPCEEVSISRQPLSLRAFFRKLLKTASELGKLQTTYREEPATTQDSCQSIAIGLSGSIAEIILTRNYSRRNELVHFSQGQIELARIQKDFSDGITIMQELVRQEFGEELTQPIAARVLFYLHQALETEVFSDVDMQRALMALTNKIVKEGKIRHPDYAPVGAHPPINGLVTDHLQAVGLDTAQLKAKLGNFKILDHIAQAIEQVHPHPLRESTRIRALSVDRSF